jgi:hypothetical protein
MEEIEVKDEDCDLIGDGSEIFDAQAEIDKISAEIDPKQLKKPEKRSKEIDWRDKYRAKRYLARSKEYLATKWVVLRRNWLNLPGFAAIFTNTLSVFTVIMMGLAMYYSVGHLRNGANFTLIIAGAVLIGVIGWTNSRIGDAPNEKDDSQ